MRLALLSATAVLVFFFQNCGPAFKVNESLSLSSLGGGYDSSVDVAGASTPNTIANCTDSTYTACLIWKNPVAHEGRTLSPTFTSATDLSSWKLHAVEITGYDNSGTLTNSSFDILAGGLIFDSSGAATSTTGLQRVSTASGEFKFTNNNDPNHKFQQVSAFYWLNFQKDFMTERVGTFYAAGKAIKVYTHNPDYNNGFYDSINNRIALGGNNGDTFAVHAEIITHEMGHANVNFASNGEIWKMQGSPDADSACIPNSASTVTCCPSRRGCAKALNEGLADFHADLIFPSRPAIGETWANSTAGLQTPAGDLYRDPTRNAGLTADDAFDVVANVSGQSIRVNGESRSMAALYTSIWWELRRNAAKVSGGTTQEMDTIFSEHLAVLTGFDTLVTARDKILAIDKTFFTSKYHDMIAGEFKRRGY